MMKLTPAPEPAPGAMLKTKINAMHKVAKAGTATIAEQLDRIRRRLDLDRAAKMAFASMTKAGSRRAVTPSPAAAAANHQRHAQPVGRADAQPAEVLTQYTGNVRALTGPQDPFAAQLRDKREAERRLLGMISDARLPGANLRFVADMMFRE